MGFEGPGINPYAPPQAVNDLASFSTADAERPIEGADFPIRAAARVVDVVVHMLAGAIAGFLAGVVTALLERAGVVQPGWLQRIRGLSALGLGLGLLASVLFHTICEGMAGATPGKYVCGLRVVLDNGRRCNIKAALIRSLGYFIDALFCGLIAYSAMKSSPLRQRHGDRWADTVVVSKRQLPEGSQATAGTTGIAWAIALGLTLVLQALALVVKAL